MSFGRAILSHGLVVASGFGQLGLENSDSGYVGAVPLGGKSVKSSNSCPPKYQAIVKALNDQFNTVGLEGTKGAGFFIRTVKTTDGAPIAGMEDGNPYCEKFPDSSGLDHCHDTPLAKPSCSVICNEGYLQTHQGFVSATYLRRDVMWKLEKASDVGTDKECIFANGRSGSVIPTCPFYEATTTGGFIFDYEGAPTWPAKPKCYFDKDASSQADKSVDEVCHSVTPPGTTKRYDNPDDFVTQLLADRNSKEDLTGNIENEVIIPDWSGQSLSSGKNGFKAFFYPCFLHKDLTTGNLVEKCEDSGRMIAQQKLYNATFGKTDSIPVLKIHLNKMNMIKDPKDKYNSDFILSCDPADNQN